MTPTIEIRPWREGDDPNWVDATSITLRCQHGYMQRLATQEVILDAAVDVIRIIIAEGVSAHDRRFSERCFAEIQQRYVTSRFAAAGER